MKKIFFPVAVFALIVAGAVISMDPLEAQYGGGGYGGFAERYQIKVVSAETRDEIDTYLEKLLAEKVELPAQYQAEQEAEARIRTALDQKIDLDFDGTPLTEIVEYFRETLKVNIRLDKYVIKEAGGEPDEQVTLHVKQITARAGLELMLRSLIVPLEWTVRDEMLFITTFEEADYLYSTKFYDVTDLVITRDKDGELVLDYGPLKETIKEGCDLVALWEEDDGEGGSLSPYDALGIHTLLVRQTREIHDQIEVLLANLRRSRTEENALLRSSLTSETKEVKQAKSKQSELPASLKKVLSQKPEFPAYYRAQLEAEARIRNAFAQQIDLDYVDVSTSDVIEDLRKRLKIQIALDKLAIEESGCNLSQLVSFSASGISAQSALQAILENLDVPLTWLVRHEMVWITVVEEADAILETKVYDVTDLMVSRYEEGGSGLDYFHLIALIEDGVDENALWSSDDGEGGVIVSFESLGIHVLVVNQTRMVHDEIEVILAGLRRQRKANPKGLRFMETTVEQKRGPGGGFF